MVADAGGTVAVEWERESFEELHLGESVESEELFENCQLAEPWQFHWHHSPSLRHHSFKLEGGGEAGD